MSVLKSFILYDGLPIKSGGAHRLSKHSNEEILHSVTHFIATYTNAEVQRIGILMPEFKFAQFVKYCFRFGFPSFDWWNYWEVKQHLVSWNASPKIVDSAVDLLEEESNLVLTIAWRFYFIDPYTGTLLPKQEQIPVVDERKPRSEVYLRLSKFEKTASAWFALPFEELNQRNLDYITALQDALPFKFSSKNWRIYKYSKNENWFPRRLEF